eukprot:363299-Chlamydomonas_euryale.AAC.9
MPLWSSSTGRQPLTLLQRSKSVQDGLPPLSHRCVSRVIGGAVPVGAVEVGVVVGLHTACMGAYPAPCEQPALVGFCCPFGATRSGRVLLPLRRHTLW